MLTSLRIENFAIVSLLELDFNSGMTAFTGETGAGKSIMIDALMLALGGRGDVTVIRPGAEKCDIHACFQFDPDSPPAKWLLDHDLSFEEGELFLRRVIYTEGRSKSYINGQLFPLQKVKELSERLVDIHGQHQHQTLLQHATHRKQLDQFAGHDSLLAEVNRLFREHEHAKIKLDNLKTQSLSHERVQLLQFQIEELQQLNLKDSEMQALHEEHQLLHHARDYLECAQQISSLLEQDDSINITRALSQAIQLLASLPQEHAQVKTLHELLNSALIQCEEASDEIERFSSQVQLDPERLQIIEARLSALHQAARKYHVDANQLGSFLQNLQEELHHLQSLQTKISDLEKQLQQLKLDYEEAALTLRASRKQHAAKLAEEISQTIRNLGMPKGFITLEINPLDKILPHGQDKVEYKVCTNPGMQPDALNKVASGGELSRISLAIQMITAERGATPTLLFDEVDVGIGGATAALVGQLLRKLGERLQVFCVTHQPQVAACAHHHFVVEKKMKDDETFSRIIPLKSQDKVDEIARMLGGLTITEQTRSHARELLAESS